MDEVFIDKSQGCQTHELIYCPDTYRRIMIPKSFIGALSVHCNLYFRGPTKDILLVNGVRDFIYESTKDKIAEYVMEHELIR